MERVLLWKYTENALPMTKHIHLARGKFEVSTTLSGRPRTMLESKMEGETKWILSSHCYTLVPMIETQKIGRQLYEYCKTLNILLVNAMGLKKRVSDQIAANLKLQLWGALKVNCHSYPVTDFQWQKHTHGNKTHFQIFPFHRGREDSQRAREHQTFPENQWNATLLLWF